MDHKVSIQIIIKISASNELKQYWENLVSGDKIYHGKRRHEKIGSERTSKHGHKRQNFEQLEICKQIRKYNLI
jgi:hypothetical protein